jgi:hypothetical protein
VSARSALCALACALAFSAAHAEPIQHLFPPAAAKGAATTVTPTGKYDPWPPQVWCDSPEIHFLPAKEKGRFDVEVTSAAKGGPHLVRFIKKGGGSDLRFLIVTEVPDVLEVEPNDDFKAPQHVPALPATVDGRLEKVGDVDSFAIALKSGERLSAWVDAYILASTFDGILRIVDTEGHELAFNHDGRTLDPALTWIAPRDGTYVLQLFGFSYPANAAVTLTGGEGCVYRLHLTHDPLPADPEIELPGPEIAEHEPNDTGALAQAITLPCHIKGAIDYPGDQDCFSFPAKKGQLYTFTAAPTGPDSPVDPSIGIEGAAKSFQHREDTAGHRAPSFTWTATADGPAVITIGDFAHQGGPAYTYLLSLSETSPSLQATAAADFLTLAAGNSADFKITLEPENGFASKLILTAEDLPEGITAAPVEIPAKATEATLKCVATAAAPGASQPFRLHLHDPATNRDFPVRYMLTTLGEANGVPTGYTELVIDSLDQFWLTVLPVPEVKATASATKP